MGRIDCQSRLSQVDAEDDAAADGLATAAMFPGQHGILEIPRAIGAKTQPLARAALIVVTNLLNRWRHFVASGPPIPIPEDDLVGASNLSRGLCPGGCRGSQ